MNTLLLSLLLLVATPGDALEAGGKTYPGANVTQSTRHPYLDSLAQKHSEYQARVRVQGHQNWNTRFNQCLQKFGQSSRPVEICAESWPWDWNLPPEKVGRTMYNAWRQSAGHWKIASRKHKYAGYGMAQEKGGKRRWFATIITVD